MSELPFNISDISVQLEYMQDSPAIDLLEGLKRPMI